MIDILRTPLAALERQGRLQSAVLKSATHTPRRFGFQGDLLIRRPEPAASDSAPAEGWCSQTVTFGLEGAPTLPFLAGQLRSFSDLKNLAETLQGLLKGGGKYFVFCADVPPGARYQVPLGGALWYVLPLCEASVESELVKLLYLDKLSFEELEPVAKLDAIADEALAYDITFDMLTYAEGVARFSATAPRS